MIYAVLIALLIGAGSGFYGAWTWQGDRAEAAKAAQLEAENALRAQAEQLKTEAAHHIDDSVTSWEVGKAEGLAEGKRATSRATADVQQFTVFRDCTLPPQSLSLLNAALRGVRSGVTVPPVDPGPQAPTIAPQPPAAAGGPPPKPVPRKRAAP